MKKSQQTIPAKEKLDFSSSHPVPFVKSGLGVYQNTYSGGRTGASVNYFGGLSQIIYWGRLPERASTVFFEGNPSSSYQRCFRSQIIIGDEPYNLEFSDTSHFPFGYISHFSVPERGVELRHRVTLLNDAFVFSIEVLKNAKNVPLRQRFEHHDACLHSSFGRTVEDWQQAKPSGAWILKVKDEESDESWQKLKDSQNPLFLAKEGRKFSTPWLDLGMRSSETVVAFFSAKPLEMRTTHSRRRYFTGQPFRGGTQATVLLFANEGKAFNQRMQQIQSNPAAEALEREVSALEAFRTRPTIESGNEVFDSLFANIPAVLASLMVQDVPGAFRASSMHYWVWGWDTFMCSEAYLLSGQSDFLKKALRFFRDTAHPEKGMAHQLTRTLQAKQAMSPASQLLYTIVLYQYGAHTGDRDLWKELYPFVKRILELNREAINEQGLREGRALFPDFPQFAGHTGEDISVFNNSLLYQGVRCLEAIAAHSGDKEVVEETLQISRRMEQSFVKTFWDRKRGYLVDSVDAKTRAQRPSYPAHALLWQTPFLTDLTAEKLAEAGRFIAANHQAKRGFLMYPRWDQAFDGDGNQFGQSWSTHDVFTTRAQAMADLQERLDLWIENSSWFWEQLSLIEGYSAQTVNDSGTPDLPGGKQGFCRSIYVAFVTNIAGLHFDLGGLTILEGASRHVSLANLPFRNARLSVRVKGSGPFLRSLRVNGNRIRGTRKIPVDLLKHEVDIVAERTSSPPRHPVILSLNGAEVIHVEVKEHFLRAEIRGSTHTWLFFYARAKPTSVAWNGISQKFHYDRKSGQGKILLPLITGETSLLEIT